MDTLPLDFTQDPPEKPKRPRPKRIRSREVDLVTGKTFRKPDEPQALLRSPEERVCGFCGHRETVLGDAAVCAQCGSVIVRGA
jgi:hypothetical protein